MQNEDRVISYFVKVPPAPPPRTVVLPPPSPPSSKRVEIVEPVRRRAGPCKIPPPPKMHQLLPASSTESESASALSARSAPTPDIVVVNEILISPPDDLHRFPGGSEGLIAPDGGGGSGGGGGGGGGESGESTAGVMEESENVPAPPEFSGAGSATASINDDVDQDTEGDVDDVLSSSRAKSSAELTGGGDTKESDEKEEEDEEEEEVSPLNDIPEEITTTSQDSTIKRRQGWDGAGRICADADEARRSETADTVPRVSSMALSSSGGGGGGGGRDDDQEVTFCAGLDKTEDILGSVVTLESPPTVFAEDGESATDATAALAFPGDAAVRPVNVVDDDNVKIADMYVRLASSATSSTNGSSSSANTTAGATSNSVPFIGKMG